MPSPGRAGLTERHACHYYHLPRAFIPGRYIFATRHSLPPLRANSGIAAMTPFAAAIFVVPRNCRHATLQLSRTQAPRPADFDAGRADSAAILAPLFAHFISADYRSNERRRVRLSRSLRLALLGLFRAIN